MLRDILSQSKILRLFYNFSKPNNLPANSSHGKSITITRLSFFEQSFSKADCFCHADFVK